MGFLLGLMIGSALFLVGLLLGVCIGFYSGYFTGKDRAEYDDGGEEYMGEPRLVNTYVLNDYAEFVALVIESRYDSKLEMVFPSNYGELIVRFISKEKYLESCLNIDSNGLDS